MNTEWMTPVRSATDNAVTQGRKLFCNAKKRWRKTDLSAYRPDLAKWRARGSDVLSRGHDALHSSADYLSGASRSIGKGTLLGVRHTERFALKLGLIAAITACFYRRNPDLKQTVAEAKSHICANPKKSAFVALGIGMVLSSVL